MRFKKHIYTYRKCIICTYQCMQTIFANRTDIHVYECLYRKSCRRHCLPHSMCFPEMILASLSLDRPMESQKKTHCLE